MYYKRILTFMFPVLFSPTETVYFLGFYTSWIRIRIQEAYLYADPCGSGSETLKHITVYVLVYSLYCTLYALFHLQTCSILLSTHSVISLTI